MSLIITKETGNFFSLVLDGGSPIISEQNRLTTIGDFCNFKTANGANLILKQNILFSDIIVIDGSPYNPDSINNLWLSLIYSGFFIGLGNSGGGSGIDRFDELLDTFSYFGRDGQLLIVNESELRLDTISYQIFTEADKLKLNGIEVGAQVNVNADWLESDPESDAYIFNKPPIDASFNDIYVGYFVTDGITNDIELPLGVIITDVYIDRGVRLSSRTPPEYVQVDNILTLAGATLAIGKKIDLKGLTQ